MFFKMRSRHTIAALSFGMALTASAQLKSTNGPVVKLTLEEAVVQALQNNFDIAIQRVQREEVAYDLSASYGPYDPVYTLTAGRRQDAREAAFNTQSTATASGSLNVNDSVSQSITGEAPTGLKYQVGLSFSHLTGYTGSTANSLDQYTTDAGAASLTQPLLRDMWINSNRRGIRLAKLNRNISDLDFENQVMTVVRDVQKAYYDLVSADEQIKVNLSAHDLANQLAKDIRRKVEVGTAAPLEDKAAESQAQTALADYYTSVNARNAAENRLKTLTTQKYQQIYESRIEPVQKLLSVERREIDLQESWRNGLSKRPDYRSTRFRLDLQRVNLKYAKNQIFPRLDLTGSYGRRGTDVQSNPLGGPRDPADLGSAFADIRNNTQPYHAYGVVFSLPFTRQAERANLNKAKATENEALLTLEQLEQKILVDIDDTISTVKSSSARIRASRLAREYAEEALAAEQKKLESGVVQITDVLIKQDALTQARSAENKALLDFNKALSDLDLNDGTILERNQIQIRSMK